MTNETIITLLVSGIVISKTIIGILIYHLLKRNRQLRDEKLMLSELSTKLENYVTEVRHQNKELTKAEEFKLKVLSLASHDLRTPFVNLQMLLNFRHLDGFKETLYTDQFLDDIARQVNKGKNVVNDILVWASGQLNGTGLVKEDFGIKDRMESTIIFFDQQIKQKELQVELLVQQELSSKGNPGIFDFFIRNIISNAIKYSPQKGRIEIGTHEVLKNGKITLFIKDNGNGMNEHQVDFINSGKSQANNNLDPYHGMGIGLSLCQNLAKQIGWGLSVESQQGNGAKFYIELK
ncbi:sensor histidine kinase [Sphingobacterium sp. Mn56C]|uniref:sensor histidine kinase n=1 Tax=Sphingobacterium sp. Mn56C TaxID=3395261 RepID=UPI003BD68D4F